jgi:histidinol-phosphate/aromatic aminotransferase/cobyric acid decarboxylase-like protein
MKRDDAIKSMKALKRAAGSHSPSRAEIVDALGYDPVQYDFCFLSNPYATDLIVPRLRMQLTEAKIFQLLESYPATGSVVARRIAKFEGADSSDIIVGNGAIQCIDWVCNGWGIQRLLVPTPTFSTYYEMLGERAHLNANVALGAGMNAQHIIHEADQNDCDAILLIHPNNPSGEALPLAELGKLVENLGHRKLVVDESFSHFLSDYSTFQSFRNACDRQNVVFIKSMSKDFGIAGIRLGYMTTVDPSLKDYAVKRSTWNLNNMAVAFSELLDDDDFVRQYWSVRKKYLAVRDTFGTQLMSIPGIETRESEANFFLVRMPEGVSEDLVFELLIDSGIYVRTMEDKIGLSGRYIRIACRRPEENQLLLNALVERL